MVVIFVSRKKMSFCFIGLGILFDIMLFSVQGEAHIAFNNYADASILF